MSDTGVWRQLATEVDAGNLSLRVDRESLDAAIKGLQDFIDHVNDLSIHVETVGFVTGFGGFKMGQDLAAKFTQKGSGEGSIRQRLKELIEEAKAAQDVLRKAAAAYAQAEHDNTQGIAGTAPT
ncbi:hypothetical protein [Nocardia veterana]|uniref:Excreted virulence factor EspC (Type VII ESX diderm) n=1 Tax=Nocardia veterana TaxID=132249 RepID=A0A7X6RI96_9NOCA|nr:hypothetical protein [Nocardia veterana]NKY86408.1 hypothetical protein [Nocardia veterana]